MYFLIISQDKKKRKLVLNHPICLTLIPEQSAPAVEHAAHAAQIGNAPLVVGRFAGGVATGSTLGGVPSAVLLSPRRRPSQSPSAALVSRQTPVLTVQPSTADLLASGGSHDGAPIALGGSISKRLTFESFLAVLLRLANQRADILRAAQSRQQQQPPPSTQSALLSLLNAHVLPFAARWGFDAAHDEALGAADVQATLLYYRPFLARAYAIYATTERSNFLTYLGMQQFCSEFGIVEGMHLTQHEIGVAFLRCKGRQAHTSQVQSNHRRHHSFFPPKTLPRSF